jgi:hypothetical protein
MKYPRPTYLLSMLLLPLLALTWFSAASPVRAASPATLLKFSGKGLIATADFTSTSGCLDTGVSILSGKLTTDTGTSFETDLLIVQVDTCTNTEPLLVLGFSQSPDLQISQSFDASLNTTIAAYDFVSNRPFTASVSLTWTATSHIGTQSQDEHFHTPEFTHIFHFEGNLWDATASGTVSDGTTNFTPSAAVLAETMKVNFGSVTITQP